MKKETKMGIIEFEKWAPSAEDPHKREYAGQRAAQEADMPCGCYDG